MSGKVVLHSYWRSSCSWRVRIALAELGVAYEYRAVHLVRDGGEQHTPAYRRVNPAAMVPALEIDGHTLTQSSAILEYLAETRASGSRALLPADPIARAHTRALLHTIAGDTQPIQNLSVLQYLEAHGGDKREWGRHFIARGLRTFEALLARTAGQCCVGDSVTLADIALVPQVGRVRRPLPPALPIVLIAPDSHTHIRTQPNTSRFTMPIASMSTCPSFQPSTAFTSTSSRCRRFRPRTPRSSPTRRRQKRASKLSREQ